MIKAGTDYSGSRRGEVTGSCDKKNSNITSGSVPCVELLYQLRNSQLHNEGSELWNYFLHSKSDWIHRSVQFAPCPNIRSWLPPDVATCSTVPKILSGCFRVYFHHNDYSEIVVVFLSPSRPYQDRTSNETRLQTILMYIGPCIIVIVEE